MGSNLKGSNEPVKNGCEVTYEMFHLLSCEVTGSNHVEVVTFSGFYKVIILLNCVHNCDNHSLLDLKSLLPVFLELMMMNKH